LFIIFISLYIGTVSVLLKTKQLM